MDLLILAILLAAIIGVLVYVSRRRRNRTIGTGGAIGETIERPTRPFDKR
jgi:hypothetical protein